jgi:hypothetical protein
MTRDSKPQTQGRKANAAQNLGERAGLVSKQATERTGRESRRRAGPDGPDAGVAGRTFKQS